MTFFSFTGMPASLTRRTWPSYWLLLDFVAVADIVNAADGPHIDGDVRTFGCA